MPITFQRSAFLSLSLSVPSALTPPSCLKVWLALPWTAARSSRPVITSHVFLTSPLQVQWHNNVVSKRTWCHHKSQNCRSKGPTCKGGGRLELFQHYIKHSSHLIQNVYINECLQDSKQDTTLISRNNNILHHWWLTSLGKQLGKILRLPRRKIWKSHHKTKNDLDRLSYCYNFRFSIDFCYFWLLVI